MSNQRKFKDEQHSVKMDQYLHNEITDRAFDLGVSVSEAIRMACRQFNLSTARVEKAKKILAESSSNDMQLIRFAGESENNQNKIKLYNHRVAFSDIKNMGEKADDTIMEFMRKSISDGTLLSKGEVKTSDGSNIILFRVHLFDVYCHFGPGQITILAVW